MLDNVNQTHLVLASAKLLLQKPVQFFRNHHKQTNLFGSSNPNQSWKGTIDILVGTKRAVGSSITQQDLEIFLQALSTRMIWLKLWLLAKLLQQDSMSWPRNLCPWITHSLSMTWDLNFKFWLFSKIHSKLLGVFLFCLSSAKKLCSLPL